jgi:hypothetical protein
MQKSDFIIYPAVVLEKESAAGQIVPLSYAQIGKKVRGNYSEKLNPVVEIESSQENFNGGKQQAIN